MRLTLRTLLAYMDDILDPSDQADISRQVEESDKATELIHRTRDSMRRLRLGAPPVIGNGRELDPNGVAEYLDNTMSSEEMTEFQQVCLDSEVHLAEVASCHHILTMVLGEPAEIDPAMRPRMYAAPERLDEWKKIRADGPHPVAAKSQAGAEVSKLSQESRPAEVPDYLRASERAGAWRWGLAMVAALLLGALAVFSYRPGGWLNKTPEVAQAVPPTEVQQGSVPKEPVIESREPESNALEAPLPPTESPEMGESEAAASEVRDPEVVNRFEEPTGLVEGDEVSVEGTDETTELPGTLLPEEPGSEALAPSRPTEPLTMDPPADESTEPGPDLIASTTPAVVPGDGMADGADEGTPEDDASAAREADSEDSPTVSPAVPLKTPMGTLVGLNQVLLRYDEANSEWRRLAARSSIATGDRLLSLPTYRPSLALVSGLRVEFSDGAMATFGYSSNGVDGDSLPRLGITYGRFLLQNTSQQSVAVELLVGNERVVVNLHATAVLGIDVDRPFVPGYDVEETGGPFAASFYAPDGQVGWDVGNQAIEIAEPSQWTWESARAGELPQSLHDEVKWLDGQSLDYLDQKVSRGLEKEMDTERPARQQLLEFFENSRRREEKSLGALASTHVGQFAPFVVALADTQQKSNWGDHIAHLRRAMSRSPEAAQLVRETFVEQRGAGVADDLMEMLRGYGPEQVGTTPEEVKAGITPRLIDLLNHDRLEYRVLAFHNLQQIYGGKSLRYNPASNDRKSREGSIRTWRKRLADNELTPTKP